MLTLLFAVVAKSEENLKHKSKHQISKNINLDINYLNKKMMIVT